LGDDGTFLRGIRMTDAEGVAEFRTIYPGWYTGRAVHIHVKVSLGRSGTFTGQLFFDDAISDQVFETEAYAGRPNEERLRNDGDNILGDHADEPGFIIELTQLNEDAIEDGFLGTITVGVDPEATPTGNGGGQGGPPGGGPSGPGATETAEAGT
jgi:protocatechuate 3,4-dioxygenase beta subunit